jgi:hypothetical protein
MAYAAYVLWEMLDVGLKRFLVSLQQSAMPSVEGEPAPAPPKHSIAWGNVSQFCIYPIYALLKILTIYNPHPLTRASLHVVPSEFDDEQLKMYHQDFLIHSYITLIKTT